MTIGYKGISDYYRISIDDVYELFRSGKAKYVFIDVRKPHEWETGVIPGALKICLDDLESRLPELKKTKHYILVCRYGGRSSIAAKILSDNGFPYVYNFQGGMIDWTSGNYPLEFTR